MPRHFVLLLLLLLAACASGQPRRYFVLADAPVAAPAATAAARGSIAVASTAAAAFYDTTDIAFSRSPGTRGYYRDASWTEPPADTLGRQLLATIAADGAFETVSAATSGVRTDLLLTTMLLDLHHDAAAAPGTARVELAVELLDLRSHGLVARRTFAAQAPAPSFDAAGAVTAFRTATTALLRDVDAWVLAVRPVR